MDQVCDLDEKIAALKKQHDQLVDTRLSILKKANSTFEERVADLNGHDRVEVLNGVMRTFEGGLLKTVITYKFSTKSKTYVGEEVAEFHRRADIDKDSKAVASLLGALHQDYPDVCEHAYSAVMKDKKDPWAKFEDKGPRFCVMPPSYTPASAWCSSSASNFSLPAPTSKGYTQGGPTISGECPNSR